MTAEDADKFWDTLVQASPRRVRFAIPDLLTAFHAAFPHLRSAGDVRERLADLLTELKRQGRANFPERECRRSYDWSERIPLPRSVVRLDRRVAAPRPETLWRPELAFASSLPLSLQREAQAVQEWLRTENASPSPVALRERSVEIFGDEKRLDALLGTQLFGPLRISLKLLRCYLPTVPIHLLPISDDGRRRPLLVVENHTTFDTLARWNTHARHYCAIGYGAGTAFVASCASLRNSLAVPGCSGEAEYFGDLDPTGLWIPAKAAESHAIHLHAAAWLYELLLTNAARNPRLPSVAITWRPELLYWLPERLRSPVAEHFRSGRRLPQELVTAADLAARNHGESAMAG